ncbi:PAS domain S-box protein [Planctomycetota bacterium]
MTTVVTDSNDAVTLMDLGGRIEAWNRGAERTYGYTEAEAVGMSVFQMIPAEHQDAHRRLLDDIEHGRPLDSSETQRCRHDGCLLDIWLTVTPLMDETGRITAVATTERDITEQKQTRKAIAASEARFRSTFEQVAVGMAHLSYDGCCERVNQQLCDILGFPAEELVGHSLHEWTDPEDLDDGTTPWEQLWHGQRTAYTLQKRVVRKDRSTVWVQVTMSHVQIPGLESDYVVLVVQDISQRKAHEQHVIKYQQQLKALASEMTLTEERLKRQVATQLHDTIGQSLVFSKLQLESLKETVSDDDVYDTLTSTCEILDQALNASQSLTLQLSYPVLAVLGLERGIEKWLDDEIATKHGIQTHFSADLHEKSLDEDLRMVLFRGVRELLNNVVKHARATQVTVSVLAADEHVFITVEDNGAGCDPAEALIQGGSFGLLSIREALERLGGALELDTRPGHGYRAILSAPLALTVLAS